MTLKNSSLTVILLSPSAFLIPYFYLPWTCVCPFFFFFFLNALKFKHLPLKYFSAEISLGFLKENFMNKEQRQNALNTLTFSGSISTAFMFHSMFGALFPYSFSCLPFIFQARFNSIWAFAFLTSFSIWILM